MAIFTKSKPELTPATDRLLSLPTYQQRKAAKKVDKDIATAYKSTMLPLGMYSGGVVSTNLARTKWGAAMAFQLVSEVYSAIRLIYEDIAALEWQIAIPDEQGNDKVLGSKHDRKSDNEATNALNNFEISPGIKSNLFMYMAVDYLVYGQTVTELVGSAHGQTGRIVEFDSPETGKRLERLNPLGISVQQYHGSETIIQYGWDSYFATYNLSEVAYDIFPNTLSDYEGYSPTLAAMDKISGVRGFGRFLQAWLDNDGRPGMAVMPKGDDRGKGKFQPQEVEAIKSDIRNSFKGVDNSFNTFVASHAMDIILFEAADIGKQYQLQRDIANAIFEVFRVARAMLGNSTDTPYASGEEATRRYILGTVLPLARIMEVHVNNSIMPFFDPSGTQVFKFDTSKFDEATEADLRLAQLVEQQLDSGVIDLYTAAIKQGETPDESLKGLHRMKTGDLVPLDKIGNYWQIRMLAAPSVFNRDVVDGQPVPQPVDPNTVIITNENEQPAEVAAETVSEIPEDEIAAVEDAGQAGKACDCKSCQDATKYIDTLYAGDDLFPDDIEVNNRIEDELNQWAKFEKKSFGKKSKRNFEPRSLPPLYVYEVRKALKNVTMLSEIYPAITGVLDNPAIKSFASYRSNIQSAARRFWRGLSTSSEFTNRMNKAITREFPLAFNAGLERGGVSPDEITQAEAKALKTFINDEKSYVPGLADFIEKHSKANGGQLHSIRRRVDMWANRIPEVENVGWLTSQRSQRFMWKLGNTEKHCGDCRWLDGRVYTGFTWLRMGIHPRSPKLECFGGYCDCDLKSTEQPITKGRIRTWKSFDDIDMDVIDKFWV